MKSNRKNGDFLHDVLWGFLDFCIVSPLHLRMRMNLSILK